MPLTAKPLKGQLYFLHTASTPWNTIYLFLFTVSLALSLSELHMGRGSVTKSHVLEQWPAHRGHLGNVGWVTRDTEGTTLVVWLLSRNTTGCVAYKQRKCISHGSGLEVQEVAWVRACFWVYGRPSSHCVFGRQKR